MNDSYYEKWPNTARCYTHGVITIEGGKNQRLHEGSPVWHVGSLEMFLDANSFSRGQFYLVDSVATDAGGGINVVYKPLSQIFSLDPGNNSIHLAPCMSGACLIHSEITAPFFINVRTHIMTPDGFGRSFLTQLSAGESFDQHGTYGNTTFEVLPGGIGLNITNPRFKSNSTQLFLTVTQVA